MLNAETASTNSSNHSQMSNQTVLTDSVLAGTDPVAKKTKESWRLHFTRFGATWLLATLVLFIMAANYSNNLLLFIALVLLALLVNTTWITWLNIRQLTINSLQLEPIFAQHKASIKVQVSNGKGKLTPSVSLSLTDKVFSNTPATQLPLTTEKFIRASIAIKPLTRGCFEVSNLQLSCDYPLGLWRWQKNISSEAKLWVYPTPKGRQALPKPKAKQGTYLKREQGDFSHVRTYQRGDSMNHIAWKQMARTGEVMTKEFDGGEGLRQTILTLQDTKQGDIEARLSQLCRWIMDCHQKQLKYALELPNQTIAAAQGEAHKEVCLQTLAQYGLSIK